MVGVHDLGCAVFQNGLIHLIDEGIDHQVVRQPPSQRFARAPAWHNAEVNETAANRIVCLASRQDVIGALDGEVAHQVNKNSVSPSALTGIGFAINRLDSHFAYQPADMDAPGLMAFEQENVSEHSGTGKRVFQLQFTMGCISLRSTSGVGLDR